MQHTRNYVTLSDVHEVNNLYLRLKTLDTFKSSLLFVDAGNAFVTGD